MNELISLFRDYCQELDKFDQSGKEYPITQADAVFNQYERLKRCVIRPIQKNGENIGFLITVIPIEENHHLRICEAYIKPEHRNQGLMTQAVKEVLEKPCKDVRFMVFDKNTKALEYWKRIMTGKGYVLAGVYPIEKGLSEYMYVM